MRSNLPFRRTCDVSNACLAVFAKQIHLADGGFVACYDREQRLVGVVPYILSPSCERNVSHETRLRKSLFAQPDRDLYVLYALSLPQRQIYYYVRVSRPVVAHLRGSTGRKRLSQNRHLMAKLVYDCPGVNPKRHALSLFRIFLYIPAVADGTAHPVAHFVFPRGRGLSGIYSRAPDVWWSFTKLVGYIAVVAGPGAHYDKGTSTFCLPRQILMTDGVSSAEESPNTAGRSRVCLHFSSINTSGVAVFIRASRSAFANVRCSVGYGATQVTTLRKYWGKTIACISHASFVDKFNYPIIYP